MRNFLKNIQAVKKDYWLMLVALFLMKIGQFMLLPFLAIFLTMYANFEPALIGLIIGSGPIIYGITALGAGVLVDRYGVKKIMISSLFFGGVTILFFFYSHSAIWCFLMSTLTGVTRAFFDVGTKTYGISNLTIEQRKLSFSLRFMTVNTAAAIGPMIGAYFASRNSDISFKIIGMVYLLLGLASFFIFSNKNQNNKNNKPANFLELFVILRNDVALQILMLISLIIWIVYSQLDSTLAQYLSTNLRDGIKVYSLMLIVNAVGCASLQLLMTQLTNKVPEKTLSILAMTLFASGYILIAFFLNVSLLLLAAFIIMLAEITIMPFNEFLITKIAPIERIGTYYGALSLSMLGLGLGPIIGGIIYQFFGAKILFLLCSLLCILTILLHKKLINCIQMFNSENKTRDV